MVLMSVLQKSFPRDFRALIFGATGGIGAAFCAELSPRCDVVAVARQPEAHMLYGDICDGDSLAALADKVKADGPFHLIINATGLLHDAVAEIEPERSIKRLEAASMARLFEVNAIGPALVMRHFVPLLARDTKAVMAHLSARIGSISDNQIGGWTSYRAAKAAQNMIVKNAAIETARRDKDKIIVGLHPGTVDTKLSAPFQSNVQADKLFSPAQSAGYLLDVIDGLTPPDSGHVFAWDGQKIPA
jgi:NAD(P)-dependent dehydrogenase (short-subunit alcohol dehydrogenase family)